jgi:hypothetical protein
MSMFELVPRGPFSLEASAAFLEGFAPAAHQAGTAGHLHLAFVPDGGRVSLDVDGDFSAELVLLRGAGDPDHLPSHEPRLCRGAALAYGLSDAPDRAWLEDRAERWRPYRTWVALLLRVLLKPRPARSGEPGQPDRVRPRRPGPVRTP